MTLSLSHAALHSGLQMLPTSTTSRNTVFLVHLVNLTYWVHRSRPSTADSPSRVMSRLLLVLGSTASL